MQGAEAEHVFKKQHEKLTLTAEMSEQKWHEARLKNTECPGYSVFKTLKKSLGIPEQKGQPYKGIEQEG